MIAFAAQILKFCLATLIVFSHVVTVFSTDMLSDNIEILETGDYHGDEISAISGQEWWGVYSNTKGYSLQKVTIFVDSVHDVVLDDHPDQRTGKRVKVFTKNEPVFLLRGISGMAKGILDVPPHEAGKQLPHGTKETFSLSAGHNCELIAAESKNADSHNTDYKNYNLSFSCADQTQQLLEVPYLNDGVPSLLWAGDLDRDGKLDLYLDLTDHYNTSVPTLFLSSLAKEGELLGKAAELVTHGC